MSVWREFGRGLTKLLAASALAGAVTLAVLSAVAPLDANEPAPGNADTPPLATSAGAYRSTALSSTPGKSTLVLFAMAGTLMLGLAWGLARGGAGASRHASRSAIGDAGAFVDGAAHAPPPAVTEWFAALTTVAGIGRHLLARSNGQLGFRTLITGDTDDVDDVASAAVELAKELSSAGKQVVLVDWSPAGQGLAASIGAITPRGFNDLMLGQATFEQVIGPIPGSAVHIMPAGKLAADPAALLDPDRLNLVLDTLDEVYDHIIVAGVRGPARSLFETIQGRFDAAITVADGPPGASAESRSTRFLGFDVIDMHLVRYERSRATAKSGHAIRRAGPQAAAGAAGRALA